MCYEYITGLDEDLLEGLVEKVAGLMEPKAKDPANGGRPEALDLPMKVVVTLALLRTNMTQQALADLLGVSQPVISVAKTVIEPLISEALEGIGISLEGAAADRPLVVDATFVPTGNRRATGKVNYSGKRHRQCLSVHVACDLRGRLIAVSGPVPGARHDFAALVICGWGDLLGCANWVADTAYIATNAITPVKKPIRRELHETQKALNRQISGIRYRIEQCIAHLKNWKILATGYRRQLKHLPDIIRLVTQLELYRLGWPIP